MPAIPPSLLNCTVYLYRSDDDARRGVASGGSGFLVTVDSGHGGVGFPHFVTNRLVVNLGFQLVGLNAKYGEPITLHAIPEEWTIAIDDDLAVFGTFLPAGVDAAPIHIDAFLGEDCLIDGWPVYPGDETMFFGRFISHEGQQRNTPVVRFGNISMLPDEAAPIRLGDIDQVAFLVESRSLSGFSGSPAFVKLSDTRLFTGDRPPASWIPVGLRFLGVNCGHMPFWSRVRDQKNHTSFIEDMWVETNSGIAVVIPAWRLLKLLNDPSVIAAREEWDRRYEAEAARSIHQENQKGSNAPGRPDTTDRER